MDSLISKQAAIELIHSLYPSAPIMPMNRKWWKEKYKPYIEAEKALEMLPSAQPEPSDVARDIATIIENEKDMRVVLRNSEQTTLYGYDVQHLAIIASILKRENLSPETVGEILRDASRIYTIVRDEAVKDFDEAVRNCMEKAVKNDG